MKVEADNSTLYEPPPLPETEAGPKDEFLRLLVAQMQHQDPLQPQDGTEFVAQLAQFANIELGVETNKRLAALEQGQMSASRASLMSLVGKKITANADRFKLGETGGVPPIQLDLQDSATTVEVNVYDENKNKVATITVGPSAAGTKTVSWNGTNKDGVRLPEGNYTMEVVASNEEGVVDSTVAFAGKTDSVEFAPDGSTLLGLGGIFVSPASIASVAEAT